MKKLLFITLVVFLAACSPALATVASTTTQNVYTTSGGTTFAYSFKVFSAADLYVAYVASDGVETEVTTGFSVTGAGSASGGNVVFAVAPTSGQTLLIRRQTVQHQNVDLVPNARLSADTLESEFDKLTFMCQDLKNKVDRTVKFKANTSAGATVPLPEPVALNYLRWNAAGTALTNDDALSGVTVGTMAAQNANAVAITGGSIVGITDLAVADGGTGASNASSARTNLGLGTIATQAASSVNIDGGAIDGTTIGAAVAAPADFTFLTVTSSATIANGTFTDPILSGTGTIGGTYSCSGATFNSPYIYNAVAEATGVTNSYLWNCDANALTVTTLKLGAGAATVTAAGIALIDDANATAQRSTLGLGSAAVENAGTFLQTANNLSDGVTATMRSNLGLGSMALQAATSVNIDGGTIDGTTIGGTTPGAGTFTTAIANSGAFTTLTWSGSYIQSMATQDDGSVDINGGNIDGTVIGNTLPQAGIFTQLTAGTSCSLTEVTLHGPPGNECWLDGWLIATGSYFSNGTFFTPLLVQADAQAMTINELLVTNGGDADEFTATTFHCNTGNSTGLFSPSSLASNSIKSHSRGVIEGDATVGRVMRLMMVDIQDSGNPSEIYCGTQSLWNADAVPYSDCAKGDVGTHYNLSANGGELTIKYTSLSGPSVMVQPVITYNSTTTALTCLWDTATVSSIKLTFYNATTGAVVDLTSIVDAGGGGKQIGVSVLYLTNQ